MEEAQKDKKIKVICVPGVYAKCDRPSYAFIKDVYISYYKEWKKTIVLKIVYKHYRPKIEPTDKVSEAALNIMGTKPIKMVMYPTISIIFVFFPDLKYFAF